MPVQPPPTNTHAFQANKKKTYRGPALEGLIARYYAKLTKHYRPEYRSFAETIRKRTACHSDILIVGPGPGYLPIELASLGNYQIVALDISKAFVRMGTERVKGFGSKIRYQLGNVSAMEFDARSFDFIACRAAFKNFAEPTLALAEMHRVLRPGGTALIMDLRGDPDSGAIDSYVQGLGLNWMDSLLMKLMFKYSLVKRAYSQRQITRMAAESPFRRHTLKFDSLRFELTLTKESADDPARRSETRPPCLNCE